MFYGRIIMDADITAILAAIDAVSKKVDSAVGSAKDELKEDIRNLKEDIQKVQKTVDEHTTQLGKIVSVVAGQGSVVIKKTPDAVNRIEKKLGMTETVFS